MPEALPTRPLGKAAWWLGLGFGIPATPPGEKQSNEEALIINPAGLSDIESVMIYCYIFDGPAMWDKIDAKLTIRAGNVIEIPITPAADSRFTALAEITPDLCVKLLGTSHKGHADCDATYNWDFDYN